ncbi:MAG TPA: DUF2283 domain-containing protein [bacterium]|nr:DUF2283 domain-containing protein [bacterium]HPN42293.1 DUF2283 domain-containing protein [bacterium]
MEALKITEKKKNLQWNYDADADVFYISIEKPQKAEGVDIGKGVIARIDPVSHEIIGFTIINLLQRTLQELNNLES